MIGSLQPYESYRELRIQSLGKVPTHWQVRRMKSAVRHVVEQTSEMRLQEVYVALEHVESWTGRARPQRGADLFTGQVKRFRAGDVLFGKLRPYLAKVTRINRDGVCAGEFFVLRPTEMDLSTAYLELQLRTKDTIDLVSESTNGAKMPRADWQFFGNLPLPIPSPSEQAAIVRFLCWANGRLERAIGAKRKVIALLAEQKRAIIHRAVTCGLDSSIPMQEVGLPWLKAMPAHWDLVPNRSLLCVRRMLVGERHTELTLLSLTKRGVIVRDLSENKGKFSADMGTSQEVRQGDLVFCLFDVPETPRTVGLSGHSGMITGAYTVMECADPSIAAFLELFYIAMDDRKLLSPLYSGLRNTIPKARLLGAKSPVPPTEERTAILAYVKRECAKLDGAIARESDLVLKLQEFQARLVVDVVTGKLDVREVSSGLSEETEREIAEELAADGVRAEFAEDGADA
jgi:type I restriction enzyme S subunit